MQQAAACVTKTRSPCAAAARCCARARRRCRRRGRTRMTARTHPHCADTGKGAGSVCAPAVGTVAARKCSAADRRAVPAQPRHCSGPCRSGRGLWRVCQPSHSRLGLQRARAHERDAIAGCEDVLARPWEWEQRDSISIHIRLRHCRDRRSDQRQLAWRAAPAVQPRHHVQRQPGRGPSPVRPRARAPGLRVRRLHAAGLARSAQLHALPPRICAQPRHACPLML